MLATTNSVCPGAFVSVPGPFTVAELRESAVVAVVNGVTKFATTPAASASVPPPLSVPFCVNVPPLIAHTRPAASVTVPVFAKLGAVPP